MNYMRMSTEPASQNSLMCNMNGLLTQNQFKWSQHLNGMKCKLLVSQNKMPL